MIKCFLLALFFLFMVSLETAQAQSILGSGVGPIQASASRVAKELPPSVLKNAAAQASTQAPTRQRWWSSNWFKISASAAAGAATGVAIMYAVQPQKIEINNYR
jgi:hypothetical protein